MHNVITLKSPQKFSKIVLEALGNIFSIIGKNIEQCKLFACCNSCNVDKISQKILGKMSFGISFVLDCKVYQLGTAKLILQSFGLKVFIPLPWGPENNCKAGPPKHCKTICQKSIVTGE